MFNVKVVEQSHDNKKTHNMPSAIGHTMKVVGNIQHEDLMEVFGLISGNVQGNIINIREGGMIEGDVSAKYIKIRGKFNGKLKVGTLHVSSNAILDGNIEYGIIIVEQNAIINCKCIHNKELIQINK